MTGRVGDIAGAGKDPLLIYVGYATGGLWKSTDGGKTWNHPGLEDTQSISRIVVDPASRSAPESLVALPHRTRRETEFRQMLEDLRDPAAQLVTLAFSLTLDLPGHVPGVDLMELPSPDKRRRTVGPFGEIRIVKRFRSTAHLVDLCLLRLALSDHHTLFS